MPRGALKFLPGPLGFPKLREAGLGTQVSSGSGQTNLIITQLSSDPQRARPPLIQVRCSPRRGSLSRNANGMVASVSADTIITVAGMPMKSPMKPANACDESKLERQRQ
jgi:hypothetical protein